LFARTFRRFRNWVTLTPLRAGAAIVVAVALVGSAGFGTHRWAAADRHRAQLRAWQRQHCAVGILRFGPQCVGVTDGSFMFAGPQLSLVERAIRQQNNSVSGVPHATIAVLLPLTNSNPVTQDEILHEVQGAYAAQYRANHNNNVTPKIRLVLANPGVDSVHWRPVVRDLASMTRAPGNLRAVFGISVSTEQTEAEVRDLTKAYGIPVVLGAPTADDFGNSLTSPPAFPGLARVSPNDHQEAGVLTRFARADRQNSILVEDDRAGDPPDDYISSLTKAYRPDTSQAPFVFTSQPDESQTGFMTDTFNRDVPNICGTTDKYIYFAGRQVALRLFLNALADGCSQKFTVITGDAATHLAADSDLDAPDFTTGRITLDFPAIASPDAWTSASPRSFGGSPANFNILTTILHAAAIGPVGSLEDGETIINYDAGLTAATGIQVASEYNIPAGRMPALRQVRSIWPRLQVPGASGTICLEDNGAPYDKAIDVMKFTGSKTPHFEQVKWPENSPPPSPRCNPPR
jgi:hypothetical protein